MGKTIDLKGQKFGRLTVIGRAGSTLGRHALWLCKCSCGNSKIIRGSCLRNGSTKSCGCLRREINRLISGKANMRRTIKNYKKSAERRGIKWDLTDRQFFDLTNQNCFYCGEIPKNITNFKRSFGSYTYNGLDRKDNTKGYTIRNTVPCCHTCNRAKSDLTLQEFINWIDKVYNKLHLTSL